MLHPLLFDLFLQMFLAVKNLICPMLLFTPGHPTKRLSNICRCRFTKLRGMPSCAPQQSCYTAYWYILHLYTSRSSLPFMVASQPSSFKYLLHCSYCSRSFFSISSFTVSRWWKKVSKRSSSHGKSYIFCTSTLTNTLEH